MRIRDEVEIWIEEFDRLPNPDSIRDVETANQVSTKVERLLQSGESLQADLLQVARPSDISLFANFKEKLGKLAAYQRENLSKAERLKLKDSDANSAEVVALFRKQTPNIEEASAIPELILPKSGTNLGSILHANLFVLFPLVTTVCLQAGIPENAGLAIASVTLAPITLFAIAWMFRRYFFTAEQVSFIGKRMILRTWLFGRERVREFEVLPAMPTSIDSFCNESERRFGESAVRKLIPFGLMIAVKDKRDVPICSGMRYHEKIEMIHLIDEHYKKLRQLYPQPPRDV